MRSNQLSYRPAYTLAGHMAAGGVSQLRQTDNEQARWLYPMMKGHEDDGNVLWKWRKHSGLDVRRFPPISLERR